MTVRVAGSFVCPCETAASAASSASAKTFGSISPSCVAVQLAGLNDAAAAGEAAALTPAPAPHRTAEASARRTRVTGIRKEPLSCILLLLGFPREARAQRVILPPSRIVLKVNSKPSAEHEPGESSRCEKAIARICEVDGVTAVARRGECELSVNWKQRDAA